MKAARTQKIPVDWSQAKNGRDGCKSQIFKFVRGINPNRPRQNPVTLKQIEQWVGCTPKSFVSDCLYALIDDGKIDIHRRGPRSQSYVYEAN